MGDSARLRLRDNLRRLFSVGVTTYLDVVQSGAAKNGSLGRMVSDDGQNVTLAQLDLLAEALGVEPWQLLHPDFEVGLMSEHALMIARKMDSLSPEVRARAYALFVQQIDFANVPKAQGDTASAPDTSKPRKLRPVHK